MKIPLVSFAQVRILAEGVVDPAGVDAELPEDLRPGVPFDDSSIGEGLPAPGRFRASDLRPCIALQAALGRP